MTGVVQDGITLSTPIDTNGVTPLAGEVKSVGQQILRVDRGCIYEAQR